VSELKPCPFCQGSASYGESDDGGWFIACTSRGCQASTNLVYPLGDDVRGVLAEKWNTRATPPRAEVDVELASRAIDNAILLASVYDGVAIDGNKVIADLAALRRALSRATGGA